MNVASAVQGGAERFDRFKTYHEETVVMRWYAALYRWRWACALLAGVVCFAMGWQSHGLTVDPSNRTFFVHNSPPYAVYQRFLAHFGSDETIVIGIRMADGLTPDIIRWIGEATNALRALPYVEEVRSLATVTRVERAAFGRLVERPFVADAPAGRTPEEPFLLSDDGRTTAIILHVAQTVQDPGAQHVLITAVRRLLALHQRPDLTLLVSGTVIEQDTLLGRISQDRQRFIPLTVGIIIVLLLLLHAEWRSVIYALAVMAGALVTTEGYMAWRHIPLNAVTGLLAPVVLIVAVSMTVQIAASFLHLPRGAPDGTRLATVYRTMFMPCLLASLTTLIGFLALRVSPVPAMREFGAFGALGTMMAWLLAMAWAPIFLNLTGEQPSRTLPAFQAIGRVLAEQAIRQRWWIVTAALALTTAGVLSATAVRASTNLLHIFLPHDPFRLETEALQRDLQIIYPLELEVSIPPATPITSPQTWQLIERLQSVATAEPVVARTIGPADVLRYIERMAKRTRSEGSLRQLLAQLPLRLGPTWRRLVSLDDHQVRLTLYLQRWDTAEVLTVISRLRAAAAALLPAGWDVEPTGYVVLFSDISQRLVRDEVASVSVAFGVILLLLWLTMRSFTYALISITPNLLPILGLFACMAAWRIPLNVATAMIASVAVGIIFDNTIQLLYRYRDARRSGSDAEEAVRRGLARCAQPMMTSSLVIAGGFAVTLCGQIATTRQFGLLTCATVGLAMVGDLVVLPALLVVWKPR